MRERRGRDDNENGCKALKILIKLSIHPESLNSDLIKLKCSSLEFFHELMVIKNVEQ
jgi:hypothetical protein